MYNPKEANRMIGPIQSSLMKVVKRDDYTGCVYGLTADWSTGHPIRPGYNHSGSNCHRWAAPAVAAFDVVVVASVALSVHSVAASRSNSSIALPDPSQARQHFRPHIMRPRTCHF